nr:MAG TPA: tail assembly chaperone protein [Caudoviricetes sp.]
MDFSIGKVFEGEYPPEAAVWCNTRGDCSIQQVDGKYQIVENPPVSLEILAENARSERNRRIAETDYYMMPDYPADPETLEVVKNYRKALRDITLQSGFPRDVKWPVEPRVFCEDTEETMGIGLAKVGI